MPVVSGQLPAESQVGRAMASLHVLLAHPTAGRQPDDPSAFLHDYGLVDILRICRDVANVSAIASGFAVPSTQCQVDYRTHP